MLKGLFIFIALFQMGTSLLAQQQTNNIDTIQVLSGTVVDSANMEPIPFATISLVVGDSIVFHTVSADFFGEYRVLLNKQQYHLFMSDGRAKVLVNSFGYKQRSYCLNRLVNRHCDHHLDDIRRLNNMIKLETTAVVVNVVEVHSLNFGPKPDSLTYEEWMEKLNELARQIEERRKKK